DPLPVRRRHRGGRAQRVEGGVHVPPRRPGARLRHAGRPLRRRLSEPRHDGTNGGRDAPLFDLAEAPDSPEGARGRRRHGRRGARQRDVDLGRDELARARSFRHERREVPRPSRPPPHPHVPGVRGASAPEDVPGGAHPASRRVSNGRGGGRSAPEARAVRAGRGNVVRPARAPARRDRARWTRKAAPNRGRTRANASDASNAYQPTRQMEPLDIDLEEGELELPADPMHFNLGPSHPAMHGTVPIVLELSGETIVKADVQIGYLHRGFEKMCERGTWAQVFPYVDRLNYVSPMLNNVGYSLAVEKLCGLVVPDRCQWYRMALGELARISDHLTCTGA